MSSLYLWNYRSDYFQKLPINIQKAFAHDDAASFMINMHIYGKKICDTLIKMSFDYWKQNILDELIDQYPKQCIKIIIRYMEILKIKKSLCEILKLFRMMESKQPGIIKETVDEFANGDEDNLKCLKYCVYFTDRSGMLKQYLLDLGVQCIMKTPHACIKNGLLFCNVVPSVQKL